MNRRDLMDSTLKSAYASAVALEEEYTCPQCRDTNLWDPDKKECEACGFATKIVLKTWWGRLFG